MDYVTGKDLQKEQKKIESHEKNGYILFEKNHQTIKDSQDLHIATIILPLC
jgi:hypothetical protein